MLVCRYLNQNFVRVHYFVRVEYSDPALNDVPPQVADVDKLQRTILASNPRVTKFYIDWAGDGTGFELPLVPPSEVPSDEVSLEKNGLLQTSVLLSAADQPDGRCVASDASAGPLIESNSGDMVVPNISPTSSANNTSTVEPQTETPLANTPSSELNVQSS
jgi:hypothetical protein